MKKFFWQAGRTIYYLIPLGNETRERIYHGISAGCPWLIYKEGGEESRKNAGKEQDSTGNGLIPGYNAPHFAPPADDYSLSVPFNYRVSEDRLPGKLAVICHIFYTDLLDEVKRYLRNIPYPFDLFISTDTGEKKKLIEASFSGWDPGMTDVRVVPNRGRDIAPKLLTFKEVYDGYDFFLYIHTKKSPQEQCLADWRTYLLETLAGSADIVRSVFEAFRSDPKLGIISPQHFTVIHKGIGWGWNFTIARDFAFRMGLDLSLDNRIDFPSGSMFWARSAAIRPLLGCGLSLSDFPEEKGQLDETISHAIERLFFFSCEKAGFRWIKIINPRVVPNAGRVIGVNRRGRLAGIIRKVQTPLLPAKMNFCQVIAKKFAALFKPSGKKPASPEMQDRTLRSPSPGKAALPGPERVDGMDFDENFYRQANQDVAKVISPGAFDCGYTHYREWGKQEKRLWSDRQITEQYDLQPNCPDGIFAPVHIRTIPRYEPVWKDLPEHETPFLLILFAHLQRNLFYAGYTQFFRDFLPVFDRFSRIVLSVECDQFEPDLARQYSPKIDVINRNELYALTTRPGTVICFTSQLFVKAAQLMGGTERLVYYCQEFEAGFFPYGTDYIEGEKAIAGSRNIIVSTALLREFLFRRKLLTDQHVFTTSPSIELFDVGPEKSGKLFFYFRPESFHARNVAEILWEGVHDFCNKYSGYELYLVGTIDTRFSQKINDNRIFILNKLPNADYVRLVSSCDVAVAMIYSAHPGVVAFQAAGSGIPTVTNIFENRDAALLKRISGNFVPYDPVRDNLLSKIEAAMAMPKGTRSFNEKPYSGETDGITLTGFIMNLEK